MRKYAIPIADGYDEKERIFRETMTEIVVAMLRNNPTPQNSWDCGTMTGIASVITSNIIAAAKSEAEK